MAQTTWTQIFGPYRQSPRIARWNRLALKLLANAALLLIILTTIMVLLNLSWEKRCTLSKTGTPTECRSGFETRKNTVRGYANPEITAPDLQAALPGGVISHAIEADITIENPTLRQEYLLVVSRVPLYLAILAIVWLVRKIVLTVVGNNANEGDPFIKPNVWRLRAIAATVIATPLLHLWSQTALAELVVPIMQEKSIMIVDYGLLIPMCSCGALVLILAEVFAVGIRLREDVEGLV